MIAPVAVAAAVNVGDWDGSPLGVVWSAFAKLKSKTLTVPSSRTLMLAGPQIGVNAPGFVRGFQGFRDLLGNWESFILDTLRHAPPREPMVIVATSPTRYSLALLSVQPLYGPTRWLPLPAQRTLFHESSLHRRLGASVPENAATGVRFRRNQRRNSNRHPCECRFHRSSPLARESLITGRSRFGLPPKGSAPSRIWFELKHHTIMRQPFAEALAV